MSAIVAEHVSKTYRLRRERQRTLKEVVLRQYAPAEQVEALRDVSFAVEPGEALAS
jgi:ABC-type polysaccharide/polyol phosphate transport system ATPase subunit